MLISLVAENFRFAGSGLAARSGFQGIPSCSCSLLDGIFAGLTKEGLSVTGNGAAGAPNLARVSAARRSETGNPGPGACQHIACGVPEAGKWVFYNNPILILASVLNVIIVTRNECFPVLHSAQPEGIVKGFVFPPSLNENYPYFDLVDLVWCLRLGPLGSCLSNEGHRRIEPRGMTTFILRRSGAWETSLLFNPITPFSSPMSHWHTSSTPPLDASGVFPWRLLDFLSSRRPSAQEELGNKRLDIACDLAMKNDAMISSHDMTIAKEKFTLWVVPLQSILESYEFILNAPQFYRDQGRVGIKKRPFQIYTSAGIRQSHQRRSPVYRGNSHFSQMAPARGQTRQAITCSYDLMTV